MKFNEVKELVDKSKYVLYKSPTHTYEVIYRNGKYIMVDTINMSCQIDLNDFFEKQNKLFGVVDIDIPYFKVK